MTLTRAEIARARDALTRFGWCMMTNGDSPYLVLHQMLCRLEESVPPEPAAEAPAPSNSEGVWCHCSQLPPKPHHNAECERYRKAASLGAPELDRWNR